VYTGTLQNSKIKLKMLNASRMKAGWNYQRGKLKEKFPELDDHDLLFEQGKKDEMLTRLAVKLHLSKEELELLISSL